MDRQKYNELHAQVRRIGDYGALTTLINDLWVMIEDLAAELDSERSLNVQRAVELVREAEAV
jgi:hypothetical protein